MGGMISNYYCKTEMSRMPGYFAGPPTGYNAQWRPSPRNPVHRLPGYNAPWRPSPVHRLPPPQTGPSRRPSYTNNRPATHPYRQPNPRSEDRRTGYNNNKVGRNNNNEYGRNNNNKSNRNNNPSGDSNNRPSIAIHRRKGPPPRCELCSFKQLPPARPADVFHYHFSSKEVRR